MRCKHDAQLMLDLPTAFCQQFYYQLCCTAAF